MDLTLIFVAVLHTEDTGIVIVCYAAFSLHLCGYRTVCNAGFISLTFNVCYVFTDLTDRQRTKETRGQHDGPVVVHLTTDHIGLRLVYSVRTHRPPVLSRRFLTYLHTTRHKVWILNTANDANCNQILSDIKY